VSNASQVLNEAADRLTDLCDGQLTDTWRITPTGPKYQVAPFYIMVSPATARALAEWFRSAAGDAVEIGPDPHAVYTAAGILQLDVEKLKQEIWP
jgi:hypothetical protein